MQYSIEKLKNEDYKILETLWQKTFTNMDYLKRIHWSYINCFQSAPKVQLMKNKDDNKILGSGSVFYREYKVNHELFMVGITGDFSIIPEHRFITPALLLQKKIATSYNNDFDFLLSFPNKNAYLVQKRAGYSDFGKMVRYVQLLRTKNKLKTNKNYYLPNFIPFVLDIVLNTYYKLLTIKVKKSEKFDIQVQFSDSSDQANNFLERAKKKFDFINNITYDYINWRFLQNPIKKFSFFILKEKNKNNIEALIVYSEENKNVFIELFLWDDDHISFEHMLIKFRKYLKKTSIESVSVGLNSNTYLSKNLKNMGFIARGDDYNILIYDYQNLFKEKINNFSRSLFFESDNDL